MASVLFELSSFEISLYIVTIATAVFVAYYFHRQKTPEFLFVSVWAGFWISLVFSSLNFINDEYVAGAEHRAPVLKVDLGGTVIASYSGFVTAIDVVLFAGMILLLVGFIFHTRRFSRTLLPVGWQAFGIYWLFQIPRNVFLADWINLMFFGGGIAFFSTLAIHEWHGNLARDRRRAMHFLTGATAITGLVYFTLAKVHEFGQPLMYVVASQSAWLMNVLFGMPVGVSTPPYPSDAQNGLQIPVTGTQIAIILACTGIEAIAMFTGAVLSTRLEKDPWKGWKRTPPRVAFYRRLTETRRVALALGIIIPTIYILNLLRNASIAYFLDAGTFVGLAATFNTSDFELIHGVLFKIFAFLILIGLALVAFDIIPELHSRILGLFALAKPPEEGQGGVGSARSSKGRSGRPRERAASTAAKASASKVAASKESDAGS